MSYRYLGCVDCLKDIHIGSRFNIYSADKDTMRILERFLFAHEGHGLIFGKDEQMEDSAGREFQREHF